MVILSGYAHRRLEVKENTKLAEIARDTNAVQTEQIEQLWDFVFGLEEQVKGLRTITVTDRTGTRQIPREDQVDLSIRRWLTTSVFDASGQPAGVLKNAQLRNAYPFKGEAPEAQAAHGRLTAAGLVGWNGTNYTWVGPVTLQTTLDKLRRFAGRDVPDTDDD
jgi:hypothetical protein